MITPLLVRPGWPEILVGLIGMSIFGIGLAFLVIRLPLEPAAIGLIMTALSGIGGLTGFFLAYRWRIRDFSAFGIRRATWRWLLIGVAAGLLAFIAKGASIVLYVAMTGDNSNVQEVYAQGGSGGLANLIIATTFLAVLTPLGEELLFRGVVTTALLRYGPLLGVVGGALVFALFHGINPVFPAALVTGMVTGEIFRRSGSIWPAVIVHSVVNLPTIPVLVLAGTGQ